MHYRQISDVLISTGLLTLISLAVVAASSYCIKVWKH